MNTTQTVLIASGAFVVGATAGYIIGRNFNQAPIDLDYLKNTLERPDLAQVVERPREAQQKIQEAAKAMKVEQVQTQAAGQVLVVVPEIPEGQELPRTHQTKQK